MKNLHLKNLQNLDPIENYLQQIEKIYNNEHSLKKLFTPLKNLYSYIKKELESINIKNTEIQSYQEHLINYISDILKYDFKNTEKTTYSIMHYPLIINKFKDDIKNLKLLKDIDINSQWVNIEYNDYYHTDEGSVFTIFDTENHLTNFMINLNILVDNNKIIKKNNTKLLLKGNNMENLHLKNLQNLDPIDIYLNKIEKIYNNNYNFEKLITLLKKLYSHIEKELESIKIKNSKIQLYRSHLLDYIWDIQEYELRYAAKNAYSIINHRLLTEIFQDHIEKLKQLKDIDINSQWINIDHEYQYDTDEGRVLIIFNTQNHLTALHRELMILINNNIIKDISTNDY